MRAIFGAAVALTLAGCAVAPLDLRQGAPEPMPGPATPADSAARNFVAVVTRMEPLVEAACRAERQVSNCDFQIAIDDRPNQTQPNAFQTLDARGRPILAFNLALIADARNPDELAFVMGHEASHHILGHIPRQQDSARTGALVAGALATLGGATPDAVRAAQDIGAQFGARTFSQDFELEADALGTVLTFRAGYDPLLGAEFFNRLPDPGNSFLGTHPPTAERVAVVRRTVAGLR